MVPDKKSYGALVTIVLLSLAYGKIAKADRYTIPKDDNVVLKLNTGKELGSLAPEKIKFLVWNMYKGAKDSWSKDYKEIAKNADILMLQEILTNPRMVNTIKEDRQRSYHLTTSFFDKGEDGARTGVATASKYKPVSVNWQRSKYREPFVATPKMTGFTTFDLRGTDKNLLTVNIHAINFVSTEKLMHMILEALKAIDLHKGPVVFAGDFNTWSKAKLNMVRGLMKNHSMKEVSFDNDGRMTTFGNTLDHVFVRDLKVTASKVHNSIEGSDHKAMSIEASVDDL